MSVLQAFLCGVLYYLAIGNMPFVGLWTLQRPLVCGLLTGVILGHPLIGAMTGASINLVYLGFISAGGSMPADMALSGILGTAFAITGHLDAKTALSLAVPIGLLGTIVWYARMTYGSIFTHLADRYIEKEQYNKIWRANVLYPQLVTAIITIIPCGIAAYFGASYINGLVKVLGGTVLNIFKVIGGMIPALGVAITLQYIYKDDAKVFLFLGFVLATYSKLGLLPLGVIAGLAAIIYMQVIGSKNKNEVSFEDGGDYE
ncbi:PTS mannose/fructose/sorbose/N-acetylgalactosamine transporter subunit IIC [Xylocopilactobacillus apicola]|uniref:PTS mannose transporter subunit IIA n=1 Tax=Xylocopilactobacillus apicola TaxID=2932184 RepID=A0AAU9D1X9_9LACO|nr:PTS sugar transporter subunit IIC [Xylocopilactobacillus apicola]BDR57714.1 PTS mannose transporter subunit IIA [Xylocopilactobacillus apicola]